MLSGHFLSAEKAEAFRAFHRGPKLLLLVNIWDVASARIVEESGAQAIATSSAGIAFAQGYPDGQKIYAYVAIRADKLEAFMEAQKKGTFYPEDYGVIIESGEGEPTDETKQKMTKEYGFNHEAMVDIGSTEKAHELASSITAYTSETAKKDEEE